MNRYFARVEYDGTGFCGWQIQPDCVTVQGEIEKALSTILRQEVKLMGAGRTDAGVHGKRQAIHFDVEGDVNCRKLYKGVNAITPPGVSLYDIKQVSDDFHARFSARERTYKYYIATRKTPLLKNRVAVVTFPMDWQKVVAATSDFLGTHSFSSFCASGCYTDNHRCTVRVSELTQLEEHLWCYTIAADRFVYKMVRTIVGTLIEIGRGRITRSVAEILTEENRDIAGITAPAEGLVFEDVTYEEV